MLYEPGTDVSDWYGGASLQNAYPTFDFLWGVLEHQEDVEVGFAWEMVVNGENTIVGHVGALTSLKFCDANDNGEWDAWLDEVAQIDFIDPNDPTALTWCPLIMEGGALQF